jgi:hypothetical protein
MYLTPPRPLHPPHPHPSRRSPLLQFTLVSSVGIVPECAVFAYFGSMAENVHAVVSGKAGPAAAYEWVLLGVSVVGVVAGALFVSYSVKRAVRKAEAHWLAGGGDGGEEGGELSPLSSAAGSGRGSPSGEREEEGLLLPREHMGLLGRGPGADSNPGRRATAGTEGAWEWRVPTHRAPSPEGQDYELVTVVAHSSPRGIAGPENAQSSVPINHQHPQQQGQGLQQQPSQVGGGGGLLEGPSPSADLLLGQVPGRDGDDYNALR